MTKTGDNTIRLNKAVETLKTEYIRLEYKIYEEPCMRQDTFSGKSYADSGTPSNSGYKDIVIKKENKERVLEAIEKAGGKLIRESEYDPNKIDCPGCWGGLLFTKKPCEKCNDTGRIDKPEKNEDER